MGPESYLLIALTAFSASFIQRVTGFGFGIVFMTVAPFLMPSYGEATALSGMLALVCAVVTGVKLFKYVPWRKLVPILMTFLLVSSAAVRMVGFLDGHLLKKVLGGILILVSLYFFFISGRIRLSPSIPVQLGMGTISGMMGGLFAMQGPPAVIYFISCTDRKEEYMALTQWYFIIGNVFMTACRAGNGFLTVNVAFGWLAGVLAVVMGLVLGSRVYRKVSIGMVRKFVYVFIGVSGGIALLA